MSWQTVANAIKRSFHVPHALFPVQSIYRLAGLDGLKKQLSFSFFPFLDLRKMQSKYYITRIFFDTFLWTFQAGHFTAPNHFAHFAAIYKINMGGKKHNGIYRTKVCMHKLQ